MVSRLIGNILITAAYVTLALITLSSRTVAAADAPASSFYVLKGDYGEISSKGTIRFLVHGGADYLPRSGDPRAAEPALAELLATRLGVKAEFVSVAEQDDLVDQLNEGYGDVIAKDRIRFALASYNCGPGHVYDARDLAKQMGLDANKWFGHVE